MVGVWLHVANLALLSLIAQMFDANLDLPIRRYAVPGYAPQSQSQLQETLDCFRFERSVLLLDSRLELLMQARL